MREHFLKGYIIIESISRWETFETMFLLLTFWFLRNIVSFCRSFVVSLPSNSLYKLRATFCVSVAVHCNSLLLFIIISIWTHNIECIDRVGWWVHNVAYVNISSPRHAPDICVTSAVRLVGVRPQYPNLKQQMYYFIFGQHNIIYPRTNTQSHFY